MLAKGTFPRISSPGKSRYCLWETHFRMKRPPKLSKLLLSILIWLSSYGLAPGPDRLISWNMMHAWCMIIMMHERFRAYRNTTIECACVWAAVSKQVYDLPNILIQIDVWYRTLKLEVVVEASTRKRENYRACQWKIITVTAKTKRLENDHKAIREPVNETQRLL